ncbi:phosphotransferase family protein [Aquisediminimonas profunda]|uniref:phosphotransferase family protein n=1 Tax=Aquisediminimonas profunda TaxID=1550733 RepID=UPI001C63380B|nr:phosphotransferase family protein [Aquisediminimonas profunda]
MLNDAQLAAVGEHIAKALNAPGAEIIDIRRFHGGASRETYAIDVLANQVLHALILRCDPGDSLIDTPRALEFAAYKSVEHCGIPVPRAVSLCEDAALIGTPFFIMQRIEGGEAVSPFVAGAYGENRDAIGQQFFEYLGKINGADALSSPLAGQVDVPEPDECWSRELNYWAGQVEKNGLQPEPILMAAIRWLRKNPPPPAQKLTIVHGDYRNGNVLHDSAGKIVAVLDWEMAHIGDPLEDLAWTLDPLWNLQDPSRAAGLIERSEAIRIWENASGLMFDEAAFRWWEMFASVKGMAIWISSGHASVAGVNSDPVLAFSAWYPKTIGNHVLATRLAGIFA